MKQVIQRIIRNYGKRRWPGSGLAYSVAKIFLMGYWNADTDAETNGEAALLRDLAPREDWKVVFDVGANVGDWTAEILRLFPHAEVHAFEVAPETHRMLARRIADPRARLNDFALSDHAGEVTLHFNPEHPDLTSLHAGAGLNRVMGHAEEVCARTRTGDEYCRSAGVTAIDYLKIDAEGHDLAVLRGFREMLAGRKIRRIQFEYNQAAIAARSYLRDFYDLLEPVYAIHRITPVGPVRERYEMFSENFVRSNFLAVLRST